MQKVRRDIDLPFIKEIEERVAHIKDFEKRKETGRKLFLELSQEQMDEYEAFLSPSARFKVVADGKVMWYPGMALYGYIVDEADAPI